MSVPRLVDHINPEGRETPLLLLAELREIDPAIELLYFGARDWRLGAVRTGQARDERARRGDMILTQIMQLQPEFRNPKTIMLAHVLKQGFAQIAKYTDQGDPSGVVVDEDGHATTILDDCRDRDFHWRRDQGEEIVRRATAEAGGASRRAAASAQLQDYLANEGMSHYRREVRGRVQMGVGGMTGGPGRLLGPSGVRIGAPIITGEQVLAEIAQIMAELGGQAPS